MPKTIDNLREQLLEEAKKQVAEKGYAKTTIRSVAKACQIAVGTVYNYFESKDMLIASFMAEDWMICMRRIKSQVTADARTVLKAIFDGLISFAEQHQSLFSDRDAGKVFSMVFSERHKMLRRQLADLVEPICQASSVEDKGFLAEFIAESLLRWPFEGKSFQEIYEVISQLLK